MRYNPATEHIRWLIRRHMDSHRWSATINDALFDLGGAPSEEEFRNHRNYT